MRKLLQQVLSLKRYAERDFETRRVARTLRNILLLVTCGSFLLLITSILSQAPNTTQLALRSFLFFVAGYILLKKGYAVIIAWLTSAYLLFLANYTVLVNDGIHDVGIILFPVFLLLSSMLLNSISYAVLSLLSLTSLWILGRMELAGSLETRFSALANPFDLYILIILLAVTAILIRFITRDLFVALEDAQTNAKNYREIFDAVGDAVFLQDIHKGTILDINSTALKMYGYSSRKEALDVEYSAFSMNKAPFDNEAIMEYVRKTLQEGPQFFEWRARKKNGKLFWVEVGLQQTQIGGKGRILAVVRDINDKKLLEEELRQSEKMRAIGHLAGGVAHDFNNQLTGVLGFAEVLNMELTDPTHKEYLEIMINSVKRASNLTSKLLTFARKGKQINQDLELNHLLKETIQILERTIEKSIVLYSSLFKGNLVIKGDASEIQNAFLNLAINARDAVIKNGSIEFFSDKVYLDKNFCKQYHTKENPIKTGFYGKIKITDTGIGMTEKTLKRIFEPFFTTKKVGEGTGMGLAAVYGCIQEHGGIISCESKLEEGTTMTLYLPLVESTEKDTANSEVNARSSSGLNILIVDDEESVQKLASELLKKMNNTCTCIGDGAKALDYFVNNSDKIDMVLLDMIMPKMDGQELLQNIRAISPSVPIVFCSGFGESQYETGAHEAFLAKPFQFEQLKKAMFKALH